MTATTQVAFDTDREFEIIDGQLEEKEMAGALHGGVTARLLVKLGNYLETEGVGDLYTPDTTFKIGKNERLPDIGFVSSDRVPEDGEPIGIWEIAPDLAIEVVSPNDVWGKVDRKVEDYFRAGVREVWLVSPENKKIVIYHSPTHTTILTENDELTSETLLPGFRCQVGELFQPFSHRRKSSQQQD